jgi:hypothetical protein
MVAYDKEKITRLEKLTNDRKKSGNVKNENKKRVNVKNKRKGSRLSNNALVKLSDSVEFSNLLDYGKKYEKALVKAIEGFKNNIDEIKKIEQIAKEKTEKEAIRDLLRAHEDRVKTLKVIKDAEFENEKEFKF